MRTPREPFVVAPWDEDEFFVPAPGCSRTPIHHPDDEDWWKLPVMENRCFLNALGPEQAIDYGWGKGGVWFAERPDTLVDPTSIWRPPDQRTSEEFGRPGGRYEFSENPTDLEETEAEKLLSTFVVDVI